MPPGLPHRPPIAMRFWLFRRSEKSDESPSVSPRRLSGGTMSIESLENMVRSRVRMFLRHTWLVAILGTILIGAMVWAGFYYAEERDHLRIAASPLDTRFIRVLSDQIAAEHRDLHLQLVPTAGAQG